MLLIADEGFNGRIVGYLRDSGFEVSWIREINPGISDSEVIDLAVQRSSILLTEDKDFGEWVFAHHKKSLTIIFVRYSRVQLPEIQIVLREFLKSIEEGNSVDEFITITPQKIRRRLL